jgi:hypothetical protein
MDANAGGGVQATIGQPRHQIRRDGSPPLVGLSGAQDPAGNPSAVSISRPADCSNIPSCYNGDDDVGERGVIGSHRRQTVTRIVITDDAATVMRTVSPPTMPYEVPVRRPQYRRRHKRADTRRQSELFPKP